METPSIAQELERRQSRIPMDLSRTDALNGISTITPNEYADMLLGATPDEREYFLTNCSPLILNALNTDMQAEARLLRIEAVLHS